MASDYLDTIIVQACQKLGYSSLRENQHKVVTSFLKGNDVFVILLTGSGKSLCFSILPFAFDYLHGRAGSIVIIVSPLIALMKDHASKQQPPKNYLCFKDNVRLITLYFCIYRYRSPL